MEIAIGVVFLALLVGAIFLFILILALFLWRRKRRNSSPNRQFVAGSNHRSRNDLHDSYDNDYDNAAYFAGASYAANSYANSSLEENVEAGARLSYNDSSSASETSAGMSYESATEGGGYASSDSSSSYDSGSSYDSSSSSDSGSSSSGSSND